MAGSKVYVRKPLRRYERDFEAERNAQEAQPEEDPERPAVFTDITSDVANKGASAMQAKLNRQTRAEPVDPTHQGKKQQKGVSDGSGRNEDGIKGGKSAG